MQLFNIELTETARSIQKSLKKIKFIPERADEEAAGFDVRACIGGPIRLAPLQRVTIPLGFKVELEPGWEIQIRARSGLAHKNGIMMVNGIGTIDSNYRGELMAIIFNSSPEVFQINTGDRIAQIVAKRIYKYGFQEMNSINTTIRGEKGLGSTGTN